MPSLTNPKSSRFSNHKGSRMMEFAAVAGLFLAFLAYPPNAPAQVAVGPLGGHPRISGSVLLDGEALPAVRVRVDVKALTGGDVATTFTDSSGRFDAPAANTGSYMVVVSEQGYEPVEQRVDPSFGGNTSSVIITLRKIRSYLPHRDRYLVSLRDLSVPGKARHAYEKGLERLQKKDYQGSLNHFKEATNAFPDYYQAYYQAGLAHMELRHRDEAEEALQRAIDLSGGGYADPQLALGALLCDRRSFTDAERVLRRALEVDANSWRGYLFLGQAQFGLNRLGDAEKSAHQALLRNPDAPPTYLLLANIHIRRGEYVMALKYLDIFLKLKPEGPVSDQARAVQAAATRIVARLQSMAVPPQLIY